MIDLKGERNRDVDGATSVIALPSSSVSSPLMLPSLLFDDSSRPDLVDMSAVLPMLIWLVSSRGSITRAPVSSRGSMTRAPAFTTSAAGECTGGMEPEKSVDPSSACSGELLVVTQAVDSGTVVKLARAVVVGGPDEVSFMRMSPYSCCAATSTAALWLFGTGFRSEKNEISRYLDTTLAW